MEIRTFTYTERPCEHRRRKQPPTSPWKEASEETNPANTLLVKCLSVALCYGNLSKLCSKQHIQLCLSAGCQREYSIGTVWEHMPNKSPLQSKLAMRLLNGWWVCEKPWIQLCSGFPVQHSQKHSLTYQSVKEGHFVKLKSKVNDYWVIGHGPTV